MRLRAWVLALISAAGFMAGCGSPSKATAARQWVDDHGGFVGEDATGWSARESQWTGAWPWPSRSVVVGCAANLYGGTTYVQVHGDSYWLFETHGYPPNGAFYRSAAAAITTDIAAQVEWSSMSADLCGIG